MSVRSREFLDKVEAKKEAEVKEIVVSNMLRAGEPLKKIEEYCQLSEEAIRAIARKIGVEVAAG